LLIGRFSCESPVSNFAEICLVGAELIYAERLTDGRTDTQPDRQRTS